MGTGQKRRLIWHNLVHQPGFQGGLRAQHAPFQHERHGAFDAQQIGHAHNTAAPRQQAQRHLGQANFHLWGINGNAVMAGQTNLKTATCGCTIDGGHHRHAQLFQAAHIGLGARDAFKDLVFLAGFYADQPFQIAAREKRVFGRG